MYQDSAPLPAWLTPLDGRPGAYVSDPDKFYPAILAFMKVKPEDATRYDMETALGVMKRLAQWHSRRHPHGFCHTNFIRSDEGRKVRWEIRAFPAGNVPDISGPLHTGARNAAVNEVWRKLMG